MEYNDGRIDEWEWVRELQELPAKTKGDFFLRYETPEHDLYAIGFRLAVDERMICIGLRQGSPADCSNPYISIFLPEEESAYYQRRFGDNSEVFLSMAYPACQRCYQRASVLRPPATATFQISTDAGLLDLVGNVAPLQ